jgi:hypothetical protein
LYLRGNGGVQFARTDVKESGKRQRNDKGE